MLTLLIASLIQAPAVPLGRATLPYPPCAGPPVFIAAPPRRGGAWRLDELPPGYAQLAVDKRVGGCAVEVLPRRTRDGEHVMRPAADPRRVLTPTRRSEPQRGLQRHRER